MVKLNLELNLTNLNKIKTTLEKTFEKIGKKTKGTTGGGGGIGAGAVAGIGASVAIFTKLLSGISSINKLLEIISALINQLVAPFVPILLGLIKPVFVLLQKFLFGAMASLGVAGFGGDTDMGIGEKIAKVILASIVAAMVTLVAVLAGATVGWAIAIGAAFFLLVPLLIDFGLWLGARLFEVGQKLGDFLWNSMIGVLTILSNIFGVDLVEPFKKIFSEIFDIFSGIIDIIVGVFTLDWEQIKTGLDTLFSSLWEILATVFSTKWEILNKILSSAWEGIKGIWEWLLSTLKIGITKFANLFIDGLNAVLRIIDKVPMVNVGRVSRVGSSSAGTTINVKVEGNTDENTIDKMLQALRRQQAQRGLGALR